MTRAQRLLAWAQEHQKDFIIYIAIWLHVWWGVAGLLVPDGQGTDAVKALLMTGLLSRTAWSAVFLALASAAALGVWGTGLPFVFRVVLLLPQQFLLMFNVVEIYSARLNAGQSALHVFLFLPAVVPVNLFHTVRLVLFIMTRR